MEQYVNDCVRSIKEVHQHVDKQHEIVQRSTREAKLCELGTGAYLNVGANCCV